MFFFIQESEIFPSKNYDILYGGVLVLPCIPKHFQGEYSCLAETENGPVRSNIVTIDVKDATPNVTDVKDRCNTGNEIVFL